MPKLQFKSDGEFTKLCIEVKERIKTHEGVNAESLNELLSYATGVERKQIEKAFIDELMSDGNDKTEVENLYNEILTDALQRYNERKMKEWEESGAFHRMFVANPERDIYYRDMPGTGKHSGGCNRKPKPRKKVKHGNRKKK